MQRSVVCQQFQSSQATKFDQISCKASSGSAKASKASYGFGLIGFELCLPWQHIVPIDL